MHLNSILCLKSLGQVLTHTRSRRGEVTASEWRKERPP